MLSAGSLKEHKLRQRRNLASALQKQFAHLLGQLAAARLSCEQYVQAVLPQTLAEHFYLRALAAALRSLKSYKKASVHPIHTLNFIIS